MLGKKMNFTKTEASDGVLLFHGFVSVTQLTGCCQMLYKALFILYIQYFSVWFTPTKNLFHVFLPYKENKLVKMEK